MFSSHSEIMQANREGKAAGIEDERHRVRVVLMLLPEKRVADFPQLDTASAALAATGWNDCRETILRAIGVTA
jgi:hypothetical protein